MVRTSPSNPRGAGSIPDQGARIPDTSRAENQNLNTTVTDSIIKTLKILFLGGGRGVHVWEHM